MAPLPKVRKRTSYSDIKPGDLTFALFHDRILGGQSKALSPHEDLPGFGRAYKAAIEGDLLAMGNRQVTRERFAEASYTAISTWADVQGYGGLQAWAAAAAAEERAHAQKQIDYLNKRAGAVLEPVPAPQATFESYADALQTALALEKIVTAAITGLARQARAAGDLATAVFYETFLPEQIDAENELTIYVQKVARGAPIDLLDAELFEGAA